MYIEFLAQWTVIKNAAHQLNRDWAHVGMMSTDIDTLRDVLLHPVHLCLWAEAGQHVAHRFPQIEPALDSSFINWEYVTFEVQLHCK